MPFIVLRDWRAAFDTVLNYMAQHPPWASGPGEILKHGLGLLERDSDTNRRLAMISVDNAVELMIATFLGLPKRITGLQITRAQYQEASESFPKLLDALERHASDKLTGINLGEIEWYHRLRNQLYHQGNGLTVERSKIEVYAKLADTLFLNLFGIPLVREDASKRDVLGEFILSWAKFERAAAAKIKSEKERRYPSMMMTKLVADGFLTKADAQRLDSIRQIRNSVVHGSDDYRNLVKPDMSEFLKSLVERLTG